MSDGGQMHAIDIRWPIGALFAAMGLTLTTYGAVHPSFGRVVPLRINLNVWWGLVLVFFGGLMTWGAWRADRRASLSPHEPPKDPPQDDPEVEIRKEG